MMYSMERDFILNDLLCRAAISIRRSQWDLPQYFDQQISKCVTAEMCYKMQNIILTLCKSVKMLMLHNI